MESSPVEETSDVERNGDVEEGQIVRDRETRRTNRVETSTKCLHRITYCDHHHLRLLEIYIVIVTPCITVTHIVI